MCFAATSVPAPAPPQQAPLQPLQDASATSDIIRKKIEAVVNENGLHTLIPANELNAAIRRAEGVDFEALATEWNMPGRGMHHVYGKLMNLACMFIFIKRPPPTVSHVDTDQSLCMQRTWHWIWRRWPCMMSCCTATIAQASRSDSSCRY